MGRRFLDPLLAKLGHYVSLLFALAVIAVLLGTRPAPVEQLISPWAVVLEVDRLAESLVGPLVRPFAGLVSTVLHLVPGYLMVLQYLGWEERTLLQQHPVAFLMMASCACSVLSGLVHLVMRGTWRATSAPADARDVRTTDAPGVAGSPADTAHVQGQPGSRRARLQRMNPWR
jgi:hypothetical protein